MTLATVLNLIAFNEELQRFADIYGDSIDTEDIQTLSGRLYGICTPKSLTALNCCSSPDEAFDCLDFIATETLEKALQEFGVLDGITKEVFKIFVYGNYSHKQGWLDDWQDLEAKIFDFMPNEWQKNYLTTCEDSDEEANFNRVMKIIAKRFLNLLWFDLIGEEMPVVEKFRIVEGYREEYEPTLDPMDCYGSEWFLFENLLSATQYTEILGYIVDRENYLNLVEFDGNGNEVYGDTTERDYIHLLSRWVGVACAWGGY